MLLIFSGIELYNFIHTLYFTDNTYTISNEIIIIFGMVLSHHLALVFSRRSSNIKNDDIENTKDDYR